MGAYQAQNGVRARWPNKALFQAVPLLVPTPNQDGAGLFAVGNGAATPTNTILRLKDSTFASHKARSPPVHSLALFLAAAVQKLALAVCKSDTNCARADACLPPRPNRRGQQLQITGGGAGAGASLLDVSASIQGCTFFGNSADKRGGGLAAQLTAGVSLALTITSTDFLGNSVRAEE
jgi:predicted outer membrane repeat protein